MSTNICWVWKLKGRWMRVQKQMIRNNEMELAEFIRKKSVFILCLWEVSINEEARCRDEKHSDYRAEAEEGYGENACGWARALARALGSGAGVIMLKAWPYFGPYFLMAFVEKQVEAQNSSSWTPRRFHCFACVYACTTLMKYWGLFC